MWAIDLRIPHPLSPQPRLVCAWGVCSRGPLVDEPCANDPLDDPTNAQNDGSVQLAHLLTRLCENTTFSIRRSRPRRPCAARRGGLVPNRPSFCPRMGWSRGPSSEDSSTGPPHSPRTRLPLDEPTRSRKIKNLPSRAQIKKPDRAGTGTSVYLAPRPRFIMRRPTAAFPRKSATTRFGDCHGQETLGYIPHAPAAHKRRDEPSCDRPDHCRPELPVHCLLSPINWHGAMDAAPRHSLTSVQSATNTSNSFCGAWASAAPSAPVFEWMTRSSHAGQKQPHPPNREAVVPLHNARRSVLGEPGDMSCERNFVPQGERGRRPSSAYAAAANVMFDTRGPGRRAPHAI